MKRMYVRTYWTDWRFSFKRWPRLRIFDFGPLRLVMGGH